MTAAARGVAAVTLRPVRGSLRDAVLPAWLSGFGPVTGVVCAVLFYTVACPPYEWAAAAWIVPGLLVVSTRGLSVGRGFLSGLVFGVLFGLCITNWAFHATLQYFAFDRVRAGAFAAATWLVYSGIPYGLLIASYRLAARVTSAALLAPLGAWLWVASEWLRSTMLTGLPWELLGGTQFRQLTLIQIADVGGVYAVSFVVALVSIAAAEQLRALWRGERSVCANLWPLGVPVVVLGAVLGYGVHAIGVFRAAPAGEPRTIAVVQARMPNEFRWKRAFFNRAVATYAELTSKARNADLDLIVWPENAVNFYISDEPLLASQLRAIAATADDGLLVGGPRLGEDGLARNAAYLITAGDGIRDTYDKQRLVPFAEYNPLRWTHAIDASQPDSYVPGRDARPIRAGSMTIGTTICYEALFPRLVRDLVRNGAEVLVNISNDAWLDSGDGTAPRQHFSQVVFRAIENRRYLVRASDSGTSGFINPYGDIYSVVPQGTAGSAVGSVVPMHGTTLYGRWGDTWIAFGGLLAGVGMLRRRRSVSA